MRKATWSSLFVLILLGSAHGDYCSETVLYSGLSEYIAPQWSPDGNWIAYNNQAIPSPPQIYKIPSAGGTPIALTSGSERYYDPHWSPDGNWIVCRTNTGSQIYKVPGLSEAWELKEMGKRITLVTILEIFHISLMEHSLGQ